MKTVYIKGIKKYNTSIYKGLKKSKLVEGVDYISGLGGIDFTLYWIINDSISIRDFKLAIGVKYIWKHRMRFYKTYDEMIPQTNTKELTKDDIELMNRVKDSIYHK